MTTTKRFNWMGLIAVIPFSSLLGLLAYHAFHLPPSPLGYTNDAIGAVFCLVGIVGLLASSKIR